MIYKAEFIVCFNDGTWELKEMEVPEAIVNAGETEMVEYGLDHGFESLVDVCHIGVMNFYTEDDDSGTLTSYDLGEDL